LTPSSCLDVRYYFRVGALNNIVHGGPMVRPTPVLVGCLRIQRIDELLKMHI